MSNEPTDRDSETATLVVCATCGQHFAPYHNGHLYVPSRVLLVPKRRASSADDERAVLAELLRLYDYAERTKQDDDHEGDDEAFFAEWHATYARAREVLARREKEGKDK